MIRLICNESFTYLFRTEFKKGVIYTVDEEIAISPYIRTYCTVLDNGADEPFGKGVKKRAQSQEGAKSKRTAKNGKDGTSD